MLLKSEKRTIKKKIVSILVHFNPASAQSKSFFYEKNKNVDIDKLSKINFCKIYFSK